MFENYLAERGIAVPEHEPDLGIRVRPEYLVEVDGERCIVEVKSFARGSWPIRRGSNSQERTLKPMRRQIHDAARKLRLARGLDLPLVVVLTDPIQELWSVLGPDYLIPAIQGDLSVVVPILTSGGGAAGPASLVNGRNGELRNDHPYISAVVAVHELQASPGSYRSDAYVTHSPQAVALASVFFSGESDAFYDYSEATDTYTLRPADA